MAQDRELATEGVITSTRHQVLCKALDLKDKWRRIPVARVFRKYHGDYQETQEAGKELGKMLLNESHWESFRKVGTRQV